MTYRILISLGILLLAGSCGDDDSGNGNGDGNGADAAVNPDSGTANDAAPEADATPGLDAAAGVPSYSANLQPILIAKCGPCHVTGGAADIKHASSYEATQDLSPYCVGSTVYECMLIEVENGAMPYQAGCTGDPVADADNAACLTVEEHEILRAWVEGGAPP